MGERNQTVDGLRAVAAVSVMLHHFTVGTPLAGAFAPFALYGWAGVDIFFVISGFILPFALAKSRYDLRAAPRFILKRMVRLDPPYLVAVIFTVAIAYAAMLVPSYQGQPADYSAPQLLLHLGYLNGIVGEPWVLPVFWTLALEFQFYLLLAVTFPLLVAPRVNKVAVFAAVLALSCLMPIAPVRYETAFVLPFLSIFALGLLAFWARRGELAPVWFWGLLLIDGLLISLQHGLPSALIAVAAAALIATVNAPRWPLVAWLGALSYPIYLLHTPLQRGFNLAARAGLPEWAGLALVVALTLIAAYLLHRFIEAPAQRLAAHIGYSNVGGIRPLWPFFQLRIGPWPRVAVEVGHGGEGQR